PRESSTKAKPRSRPPSASCARRPAWSPNRGRPWDRAIRTTAPPRVYHYFLAQKLEKGPSSPEATELLAHKLLPFDEVMRMVQSSEIMDGLTVTAMYRVWHHLRK